MPIFAEDDFSAFKREATPTAPLPLDYTRDDALRPEYKYSAVFPWAMVVFAKQSTATELKRVGGTTARAFGSKMSLAVRAHLSQSLSRRERHASPACRYTVSSTQPATADPKTAVP